MSASLSKRKLASILSKRKKLEDISRKALALKREIEDSEAELITLVNSGRKSDEFEVRLVEKVGSPRPRWKEIALDYVTKSGGDSRKVELDELEFARKHAPKATYLLIRKLP